jgi:hypothetical protein
MPCSADDQQLAAIRSLGALNGVALHCKALEETRRMKRVLVLNLPKRRQLGELFDYETNASFMKFIRDKERCPAPEAFHQSVNKAVEALQQAYGGERTP